MALIKKNVGKWGDCCGCYYLKEDTTYTHKITGKGEDIYIIKGCKSPNNENFIYIFSLKETLKQL
jgi:hypothetical protein